MIFTVLAIQGESLCRHAAAVEADGPHEAAREAARSVHEGDGNPDAGLYVCGVFPGKHECLDDYEALACRTPRRIPDGGDTVAPFTVVGMTRQGVPFTKHVITSSPLRAEAACLTPTRLVSGVLPGHVDNLLPAAPIPGVSISETDVKSAIGK